MLLAALSLLPAEGLAGTGADDLLQRATARGLQRSPAWLALLHYRDRWRGASSVIDDPRFFLSLEGAHDPGAELEATLRAVYGSVRAERPGGGVDDPRGAPVQCRFPARVEWLEEQLGVSAPTPPLAGCVDLADFLERIRPREVTLVFPTAHMNNPGSMFGHTLLRIDSPYASALLSHAVNYAAQIDPGDNGLTYAAKGLFGFYPGYFSVMPYYDKVKQYSDMEQRDVWEYRLNLTAGEARRLTLHAWELRGMFSDYYFFDENCSYNLLFLLEAARPGLRLSDGYGPWVTPLATVEDILAAGLVEDRAYRPSQATLIRHAAATLTPAGNHVAQQLVRGEADPESVLGTGLPPEEQARVLEIGAAFEQAGLVAGTRGQEDYQQRYLDLLRVRSKLPAAEKTAFHVAEPDPPEAGHSSSRAYVAAGVRSGKSLVEAGFRPAYHELMDPDPGFLVGSQINFFDGALRYFPGSGRLQLERLDLVNIVSLSPRDRFFKPASFLVRGGLRTKPFGGDRDGLVGALAAGGGLAWGGRRLLVYGLAESEVDVSGSYARGAAWGVGGRAGLMANLGRDWKAQLEGRAVPYLLGADDVDLSVNLRQSLRLARNHALFLDLQRLASSEVLHTEASVRWNVYF